VVESRAHTHTHTDRVKLT